MKTISITVERNFHIMNDDRFIMEKISHTVELEDGDNTQFAMEFARHEIETNFKGAYPNVRYYLNFDEAKQYENNLTDSDKWTKEPFQGSWLSNELKETEVKLNKEAAQVIMKGDIFPSIPSIEQSQPKYNLLKEISNCKTLTMLKVLRKMAITDEEIKACDEKMSELTIGSKQEPTY